MVGRFVARMADNVKGGKECTSGEDMMASMQEANVKMREEAIEAARESRCLMCKAIITETLEKALGSNLDTDPSNPCSSSEEESQSEDESSESEQSKETKVS